MDVIFPISLWLGYERFEHPSYNIHWYKIYSDSKHWFKVMNVKNFYVLD